MRIVLFVKYYDGFINSLDEKLKAQPEMSYADSLDFVTKASTNIFAPYVSEFKKLGHDAELIIPNFETLQFRWAKENNFPIDKNWRFTIPKAQLEKNPTDILFINSNFEYYDSFLNESRAFTNKVVAWISCPFDASLNLSNVDHVFTLFGPHFDFFTKNSQPVTLTQGAFDPTILADNKFQRDIDFSFIGGIGNFHKEREHYLKKLVKKTPLKIWGYGYNSDQPVKNILKQFQHGFAFNKAFQGQAWGNDMHEILLRSKITFNIHGDIAKGHAVNMRLFEATGAGALLLTEKSSNLANFFTPEKEVITYSSPDEAIEKVNYYLEHEDERNQIAHAGQMKTLNQHCFKHLAHKYVDIFESILK